MAQMVENLPAMQETQVRSLGWEDPLEKERATQASILAWRGKRNSRTEEPSRLQSMGRKELDTTNIFSFISLDVFLCILNKRYHIYDPFPPRLPLFFFPLSLRPRASRRSPIAPPLRSPLLLLG